VVTSVGDGPCSNAWVKNRRVASRSRFSVTRTSMTWPNGIVALMGSGYGCAGGGAPGQMARGEFGERRGEPLLWVEFHAAMGILFRYCSTTWHTERQ